MNQVEQWKEKAPDYIDNVPVQPTEIDRREVPVRDVASLGAEKEPCHDDHADDVEPSTIERMEEPASGLKLTARRNMSD